MGRGPTPMKRPRVVLVRDYLGGEVTPRVVDLHEAIPGRRAFKRSIVRPLDPRDHDLQPAGYLYHPDLVLDDAAGGSEDDDSLDEEFEFEIED